MDGITTIAINPDLGQRIKERNELLSGLARKFLPNTISNGTQVDYRSSWVKRGSEYNNKILIPKPIAINVMLPIT